MRFGTAPVGTFRFDGVSSLILTFNGVASLSLPHPTLSGAFQFLRPVYVGQANLKVSQVQFVASAKHILPVYVGQANLSPKIVFISAGKNIVKGFIYNEILYITNTFIDQRYLIDNIADQRNVETSIMIL